MINLNIKKLIAVAAGAVLVGSALAPMASAINLTKSDLISSSGSPIVDVVVGKKAAVGDAVWAGNIAVAIGQKAYTDKTVAVGDADCSGGATPSVTGLSVDLTVGGTTSVTGGKAFYANMNSASASGQEDNFNSKSVTESNIPSLYYNGAKSYTYNGTAYTISVQERLFFTADAKFDEVTNHALVLELANSTLKYNLNLGSGIPRYENLDGVNFTDDSNDNVRIPMFGTDYLVKNVTTAYVELIQTSGETQYSEGDRITDLEGYDGEMYYIEIGAGGTSGTTQKITLALYKEDGTLVKTELFPTGDIIFYDDSTGQPVLNTLVNISEILKTVISDAEIYTPTILVGSSRILLYNDKGYPYDSTLQDEDYLWQVVLNFDGNYLKDINIQNKSTYDFVGTDALGVGEEADFPEGIGTLKFLGLQLPGFDGVSKTERTTVIKIKDGELTYKDSTYEAEHTVPLYHLALSMSDESTATTTIDGKTVWYKINSTDVNVDASTTSATTLDANTCILDGQYINGVVMSIGDVNGSTVEIQDVNYAIDDTNVNVHGMTFTFSGYNDGSNCVYLTADGNVSFKKDTSTGTLIQNIYYSDSNYSVNTPITFEGGSGIEHDYEFMVDEVGSTSRIWLFFDQQALTTQYTKYIKLWGTDTNETLDASPELADYNFYLPHSQYLPIKMEGDTNFLSTEYFIARFQFSEDGTTYDGNIFVDTATGLLPAFPNTNLSGYTYEADYNFGSKFLSESTTTTYPSAAYTDFGSYLELNSHEFKATMPENSPQLELLISGTGTAVEVTGGEDMTVAEGDTGSTTGGTRVTVTKVNYNATCAGGGAGTGECTVSPASYKSLMPAGTLVKYDDGASAATHIIVGGWKVNKMAEGVTVGGQTLKDLLNSSGDYVVDKTDGGNIIVAGYRAGDTSSAAQELINAIDNL